MEKFVFLCCGILILLGACNRNNRNLSISDEQSFKVSVKGGEEWLHDFPLLLGIKMRNPPQLAIWIEDIHGKYLSTVYVTRKIATQSWIMSGGNRRQEALPHWCYSRGVQYEDGLYLPTKKVPFVDGVSGATPKRNFEMGLKLSDELTKFVVKMEVNHSTDFNVYYPQTAEKDDLNYSGGKYGSGQPALVYAARIDLSSGQKEYELKLIGHSSPDGTDGEIYADVSSLTTALNIVERIVVYF